jgi:glycosyltransferase involved in cell wall biosynthesis
MKILFLAPYPLKSSPSQRFRFEQYFDALTKAGHQYTFQSFLTHNGWKVIYSKGNQLSKTWAIVAGFLRRMAILPATIDADIVFIHRELAPVGPPVFEWTIAKLFRKKVVYDFDDAIWLTDAENEGWLTSVFRWRSKVGSICRWSSITSCGNEFLCSYARKFNNNVRYNPTTIDTTYHKPKDHGKTFGVVVGWTGSHSTLKYLDSVVPVIQHLEKKYPDLVFMVIANRKPDIPISNLVFVPWNENSEIEDLSKIDIGIMPLPDDEWSKGKCGFKLLQYMAMEKPAVASPVGVNTTIITNNMDGLICHSANEWISALERLIIDPQLRAELGRAGRRKVEENYSVVSNTSNFLALFSESAIITSAAR